MAEIKDGCVKPARGPIVTQNQAPVPAGSPISTQEVAKMTARVGKEAIDFEANAFVSGAGFKTVKLSDYKGRWVILCFYPGDFTFV